jgi:hypothetical protein
MKSKKVNGSNSKKKSRSVRTRNDLQIARAVLRRQTSIHSSNSRHNDKEAYEAFHKQMQRRHKPFLPVHFRVVERAAQLQWRLIKLHEWQVALFSRMTAALDNSAFDVSRDSKDLNQQLDMLLRGDILQKLAKFEASLQAEIRKLDEELKDIFDWSVKEGFLRGQIGYSTSSPMTDEGICWEDDAEVEGNKIEDVNAPAQPAFEIQSTERKLITQVHQDPARESPDTNLRNESQK